MSRLVDCFDAKIIKDCIILPKCDPIRLPNGRTIRPKVEPVRIFQADKTKAVIPVQIARKHGLYSPRDLVQKQGLAVNKIELRPHQRETIKVCLDRLKKFGCLLIQFPPGYGKTVMSISLWRYVRMKMVILINRSTLIQSWKTTVDMCFGTGEDAPKVWVVGESDSNENDPDIIICMVQRYNKISEQQRNLVGFMIVDEGHLFCTPSHVSALLAFQPNFILFATATPYRDNGMDKMIDLFVCRESWLSIVSKREYFVNLISTNINLDMLCKTEDVDSTFGNKYAKAHQCLPRNELIVDLVEQCMKSKKKCMVLTTTTAHVDILAEMIDKSLPKYKYSKYYKSINNCNNYHILLGTVPKVGTGYDEATACVDFDGVKSNVLILCTSIKSPGLFEQLAGRVMRSSSPHIVILMDDDRIPENHVKGLMSFIRETNGQIVNYMKSKFLENTNHSIPKIDFDRPTKTPKEEFVLK